MRIIRFSGSSTQNETRSQNPKPQTRSTCAQKHTDDTNRAGTTSASSAMDKPGFLSPQSRQEDTLAISSKRNAKSSSARSQFADEPDSSSDDSKSDLRASKTLNIPAKFMEQVVSGKLIDSSSDSSSDSSLNPSRLFGFHDSTENVNAQRSQKDGPKEPYNEQFQKSKGSRGILDWRHKHQARDQHSALRILLH